MNNTQGFKGFIFNALLLGLGILLSQYLASVNTIKGDYTLPIQVVLFFAILLPFEHKANLYILSIEFENMTSSQQKVWDKFCKSKFFGIVVLMALIWRTYFKIQFLLLPIWNAGLILFDVEISQTNWLAKTPIYLMSALVVYSEGLLIGYTYFPKVVKHNIVKIWIYKAIVLIFTTFFTTGILAIFSKEIQFNENQTILYHLPFTLIIFFFFYIPVRYVGIISDVIDCKTNWQLWLFWVSTFMGMLAIFAA